MTSTARRRITLNKVHKWAGLAAALWLSVLAVTGLMQLNRQQWQWQWTSGPQLDESIAAHDDKTLWRHHQIDPSNPKTRVASGAAGAFLTRDGGRSWRRLPFGSDPVRNVSVLEPANLKGEWTVLAGTDDGVWQLDLEGKSFVTAGLHGRSVNGLAVHDDRLVAAVEMSKLMAGQLGVPAAWKPLPLGPLPTDGTATSVDLGRLLQDIHQGRGLFGGMADRLIWNLTAIGLFLLATTGLVYWGTLQWMGRVRRRPSAQRPPNATMVKAQKAVLWSFRTHAMVIGIGLALPLLLVFLTGIYQDHRKELQQNFRAIEVPAALLPPAYRGSSWRGQVMNVALTADTKGEVLVIANRRGVFASRDGGQSWVHETSFKGPAMRLRVIDGRLFVPGRMMRRVQVREDGTWRTFDVPKPVVMVNEMSAAPGGQIWWTRGDTILKTDAEGKLRGRLPNRPPSLGYLPWGSFAAELHEGSLISSNWKWVNNLAAVLGITLVITGFLRWRKRRW